VGGGWDGEGGIGLSRGVPRVEGGEGEGAPMEMLGEGERGWEAGKETEERAGVWGERDGEGKRMERMKKGGQSRRGGRGVSG